MQVVRTCTSQDASTSMPCHCKMKTRALGTEVNAVNFVIERQMNRKGFWNKMIVTEPEILTFSSFFKNLKTSINKQNKHIFLLFCVRIIFYKVALTGHGLTTNPHISVILVFTDTSL